MAHEIESNFFVGETPWHGLGNRIEGRPTSEEAIRAAGLDWEVQMRALRLADDPDAVVKHRAVVRATDSRVLGVVGPNFKPLQNREAFGFFDAFVREGQAAYETAGALRDGQRIWILARLELAPSEVVRGDEVRKYVLLSNSHDGSLAVRVGFTPIRVVCANTLAMAHSADGSRLLRLRHTKTVAEGLDRVRDAMALADARFEATAELYRKLARKGFVEADLRRYVDVVFRPAKVDLRAKEEAAAEAAGASAEPEAEKGDRILPKVLELFESGRGAQLKGVRGTAWAAYNAVTEYVSHQRGSDAARRLDQNWFGSGVGINQRAFEAALQMAA